MEFYKIKDNKLLLSSKLFDDDIVFIMDGIAGYIWKGNNAIELDEIEAKQIEKVINDKFKGITFQVIPDIIINKKDNPKIKQIKTEISNRLPRAAIEKIRQKKKGFFNTISERYESIKNYEDSLNLRISLSKHSILWKLSIFNCLIIMTCVILMLNTTIFHLMFGDFYLLIALIGLLVILALNLIFVLFPMRVPKRYLDSEVDK